MTKFEVGKTYTTRSACDYDCIFRFTVLSRTAKRVTFEGRNGETNTRGVYTNDYAPGVEHCKPHGTHSMCAIISADKFEG